MGKRLTALLVIFAFNVNAEEGAEASFREVWNCREWNKNGPVLVKAKIRTSSVEGASQLGVIEVAGETYGANYYLAGFDRKWRSANKYFHIFSFCHKTKW